MSLAVTGIPSYVYSANTSPGGIYGTLGLRLTYAPVIFATQSGDWNFFPQHKFEGGIAGTFTDSRDGKTYITVALGEQTWLSENLNFETSGSTRVLNNNGNVYGRLYTWQSALTACPSGWHLPSDEEWKTLELWLHMLQREADAVSWQGTIQSWWLKGMMDWGNGGQGGSQRYIFNALPGGYINEDGGFSSFLSEWQILFRG